MQLVAVEVQDAQGGEVAQAGWHGARQLAPLRLHQLPYCQGEHAQRGCIARGVCAGGGAEARVHVGTAAGHKRPGIVAGVSRGVPARQQTLPSESMQLGACCMLADCMQAVATHDVSWRMHLYSLRSRCAGVLMLVGQRWYSEALGSLAAHPIVFKLGLEGEQGLFVRWQGPRPGSSEQRHEGAQQQGRPVMALLGHVWTVLL